MAGMARRVVPQYPHHVTQRGNRRQTVFFCDADYAGYLSLIGEACEPTGTSILAYCLMPNHVHFVAVTRGEGFVDRLEVLTERRLKPRRPGPKPREDA